MPIIPDFYTDLDDWKGDWLTSMSDMSIKLSSATASLGNYSGPYTTFQGVHAGCSMMISAIEEVIDAIALSVGKGRGRYWNQLITDGIYMAAEFPEAEITWLSIVTAWAKADQEGRLWTTLSLDFMRKEVWNLPVTSFMMRTGKPM